MPQRGLEKASSAKTTKATLVGIEKAPIELSSFLKLAQVTMSGGEAKTLIQEGAVQVNGQVETRRSKKLNNGDIVEVDGYPPLQVSTCR